FNWIIRHKEKYSVEIKDISSKTALISLQGSKACQILESFLGEDLSNIKHFHFQRFPDIIVSRTGYTGEDGFELCFPNEFAERLWNGLLEAGKEFGIKPIGLGARDTLRLEMGYALYGHEIDETTNPIEAGLGWITKLNKPSFKGKEACLEAKANPKRKLVGFEMSGRAIARQGFEITTQSGETIGKVCSGTLSPTLNKPIGTGYVALEHSEPNSLIYITVRGKLEEARVTVLPFLSKERRQAAHTAEKI
ncbi:MAG: glycine cleavage T C-terminal barrel domain-containing protein, partial [Candidatus Thermochlorobacter sp.]